MEYQGCCQLYLCAKKKVSINETIKRMIILAFNELNYFKSHHEDE